MIDAILGTKKQMGQTFENGKRVPVTRIKAGPCVVTQIIDYDGFWGIQLGFGEKKAKNLTKALKGHLKGAIKDTKKAPAFLFEIKLDKKPDLNVGDIVVVADVFSKGDRVVVVGTSKGKGFAGVVKRWGFKGGPKTHGQSDRWRAPGSIGQGTNPGRVRKGKKMAGRMGGQTNRVKNLEVINVDAEKGEIEVAGPVPGVKGGLLIIKRVDKGGSVE